MDFVVNELSMHGQFQDFQAFCDAVERVMVMRNEIRKHGWELYCHRGLADAQVTSTAPMRQAVQYLGRNEQRAWMGWLTRHGPHWEDDRVHSDDDYLAVGDDMVTDSAVGEAAVRISRGLLRQLVSFEPSDWQMAPIQVIWSHNDNTRETIAVPNHWDLASVTQVLEQNPKPVQSWADLAQRARDQYTRLTFSDDAFESLEGHPFVSGAADRVRVLLSMLNRLKGCFAEDGTRTTEGHRIYDDHFTGDKAWFSDSSDTEKNRFEDNLTFRHPENPNQTIFCTWHGKVKTPQLRIHFSWPITADDPVYVVYVGPKVTMR